MTGSKPGFRECFQLLCSKCGREAFDFRQPLAIRPKNFWELCINLHKYPLQWMGFKSLCAIKCIIFFSKSQNVLGNKRKNLSLNTKQLITSFLMWFEKKMDQKVNPKLPGESVVRNAHPIPRNTE